MTVVEATARLRSRVEERVEADGALREPCRSRVLESALVLALMRRLMDFSGSRERVTRYLWLRCKSPDPLERSLALVGSGAGPAPEGEDFRTLILEQVPSYVAPRRRLVLDAVAVILGGHTGRSPETAAATAAATASATVPSSAADPAGSAPSGVLHPWARVQSVASAVIVRSTRDGPVEISADDLVALRATQDGSGRVWEGHLLAHVLALHALARLPGNDHLVRRGLTAMLPLQRADGGFPFVSDIDTWCTATGGLALAVAGASTSLLHQVAGHLVSEQKQCGGWSITNGTRLTDTDDTSVALEFLQALDPGRYKHEIDAGLGRLRALRGPDGGFPTYVAGGPSEACMTAAAVNAFAPAGRGDARLLEEARRFLAASQHRDGYFEPGWSNSRLHVLYRARMAAGPGASGLAMAARIRQLVADTQNPDGGWSREPGHTSDAISTSYALLALGRQATGSPPQRAGARWLCERQDADGGSTPRPTWSARAPSRTTCRCSPTSACCGPWVTSPAHRRGTSLIRRHRTSPIGTQGGAGACPHSIAMTGRRGRGSRAAQSCALSTGREGTFVDRAVCGQQWICRSGPPSGRRRPCPARASGCRCSHTNCPVPCTPTASG
ncbi:terpene cyclase/mutase family protein (plasmid) [Streptomyces sp. NBC_01471]|uniref:prenyltransferase/squalene oxidase repeat-containing protein n=1 Tax=Streptomyces sp. NBC_01471 TaxID=2903879 RepID=UPI002F90CF8E